MILHCTLSISVCCCERYECLVFDCVDVDLVCRLQLDFVELRLICSLFLFSCMFVLVSCICQTFVRLFDINAFGLIYLPVNKNTTTISSL